MSVRSFYLLPAALFSLTLGASAAPVILSSAHAPVLPVPGDTVVVSSEITGAATASLLWRVDGTAAYNTVPMFGAGTTWTASIPSRPAGTLVEFFVQASGPGGTATWPSLTQTALYRVEENPVDTSS